MRPSCVAIISATLTLASVASAQQAQRRTFEFDSQAVESELQGPGAVIVEVNPLRTRPADPGPEIALLAAREASLSPQEQVRLAELMLARAEQSLERSFEELDRGYQASCDDPCRAAAETAAARLEAESGRDTDRALEILAALAPTTPAPLLLHALELQRHYLAARGRDAEAASVARRILSLGPQTREAGSSALYLADDAFARGALQDAIGHYQFVLGVRSASSLHGYAHYKLAWCYYNLQRTDEALDALERARDLAAAGGAGLTREAPRDFAMMLTGLHGPTATVCARLRRFAPIVAERREIARRYAEVLRDMAREDEGVAFLRECR